MNRKTNDEEAAITHYYPGTNIKMQPGDVLYSHKYALSSFLVGHTGIVGTNYRIYHVNRWKGFGHADSMPIYLSRHRKGELITILRHSNEQEAIHSAKWAMQHYDKVQRYTYVRDLTRLEANYCSKFIWQAFYFGTEGQVDLLQKRKRKSYKKFVMPGAIYRRLEKIASFENTLYQ